MQLFGTDKKSIFSRRPKLLYIGMWSPDPGWMRSLHSHNFCEIMFVKEGNGLVRIGESELTFSKGDIIALNPKVLHTELIFDTPKRELVFLGVTRLSVDGYPYNSLVKDAPFRIAQTGEFYETLKYYFEQLIAENETKPDYFTLVSDSLLSIILSFILRLTSPEVDRMFMAQRSYIAVKEYIDSNFATIDTVDSVCRSLYVNKFYLTHIFKETLGVTPLKYIIQKRLEYAKTLLTTTDKSISDIAKECGYSDVAYFSKTFKRVEKLTPNEYRDKNK